ncbi:MAG TPA: hypothetical protein DCP97_04800 [Ruminococcaceae bacterium]|nr:hypothetical protein [Oscillospiraceae bacterium]
MIYLVAISLVLGILFGCFVFDHSTAAFFDAISDKALLALVVSVGISVGADRSVVGKLKNIRLNVLFLPLLIIIGSLLGGAAAGAMLGIDMRESLMIASGLGWYSLSGVMVGDLSGALMGTIAFLSSIMREMFAILLVPFLAKFGNGYAAIAPAAATSEDTALSMIIKYTGKETVLAAVVNGIVCSTAVPLLIQTIYKLLG